MGARDTLRRSARSLVAGAATVSERIVRTMRRNPFAALLLLCACYRYAPQTSAPPPLGKELRLTLTVPGATALVPILGRETVAVEGRVLSVADTGYVVAVSGTLKRGLGASGETTSRTPWVGESVTIPQNAVAGVELRSLDARRTGLTSALIVVAAVATVRIIVQALGSSGGATDGGGVIVTP